MTKCYYTEFLKEVTKFLKEEKVQSYINLNFLELSRISLNNQGMPIVILDFTRGAWNKLETVTYYTN